jgi:signal transduction histidine kinase
MAESSPAELIKHIQLELTRARTDLRAAEKAKDEYLQNVAHQLAAPINALKMNIEALKHPRLPIPRKQVLLSSIYSQGTILAHLIKNFSLMAHLDADHTLEGFRDTPDRLNPCQLCINYANDFQPIGIHKRQQIFVDDASYDKAGRPEVNVIKNLFAQVVYNLLENATKYGDEESRIIIGFRPNSMDVVISVTSTGIAIAPAEIPKLFHRGARSAEAKKLHPAGTGFGLYIAHRIMEIHQGDLSVETSGEQTTFIIKCPKAN